MSTSTTVNSAVDGEEAHWKLSSPTSEASQLSTPKLTFVISFHISAASAGAVIRGISKRIEIRLLVRVRRCSRSAMPRPSKSSSTTVSPA